MKTRFYIAALAMVLAQSALADEQCAPLKMVASVDLIPSDSGRREFVPVEIAGVQKQMILDLGAEVSVLTAKAADELKLKTRKGYMKLYGLSGASTDTFAVAGVKLGAMKGNLTFAVAPFADEISDDPHVAGLLGADVLSNFDVSIDFGTNKLELLDKSHCDGKVVYWPAAALAVVPFRSWHIGQIVFDVTLDGKTMKALLDTGAPNSTLRLATAQRAFTLQPGSADTPAAGHLNERTDLPTYVHTFKTLDFNGITVANPVFELIPDMISQRLAPGTPTGSLIPAKDDANAAPTLIGMNVLKHLHLYIAYKEQKLYITPAGTPKAASAAQ
jgi:predicted aspartyl protease